MELRVRSCRPISFTMSSASNPSSGAMMKAAYGCATVPDSKRSYTTSAGLARKLMISVVVLIGAVAAATVFGSKSLSVAGIIQGTLDREILFSLRLPRAIMAALAGGALAVTGVLFQAVLRDSLAEPYTIGVSGGASLGAVAAICFRWDTLAGFPAVTAAAFLGAALVLLTVSQVASRSGLSATSLLLAGIALNSV